MVKNITLLIVTGSLLLSKAFSQIPLPHRKEDLEINKYNIKSIEIPAPENRIHLAQLRCVYIMDARPDTLAIGLAQKGSHSPFFITTNNEFSSDVKIFTDKYIGFDSANSLSLIMIIKKFWMSGGAYNDEAQNLQNIVPDTSDEKTSNLEARIEFFMQKGSDYFALYRFDTTITKKILLSKDASGLVREALTASFSKLIVLDPELQQIAATRRKFSRTEIEAHNKKAFDFPILNDSIPVKGVYFSFEEFKNNKPREKDFEVVRDKLTDMIFIRQPDGKSVAIRDAWGYCDGKNQFIKSLDNYFRLQRRGNAFYIYGSKHFRHQKVFFLPGTGALSNSVSGGPGSQYGNPVESNSEGYNLRLKPFELDWDTGQLR